MGPALRGHTDVKHARVSIHPERIHVRALSDAALVDAMRASVPEAWAEFDARFRPLLERYATRVGIPRWDWSACITEVLDDEALRLIERPTRDMPEHLSAYLVRAVRNRHLALRRATVRRERRYAAAAAIDPVTDGVLSLLVSEHSRHAADPPRVSEEMTPASTAVKQFGALMSARLTNIEREMLAWVAEGVPQRVIAEWLGINREAAKKRIARLCRRLRSLAAVVSEELPIDARREIDRLMRRTSAAAGHSHSGESDNG
jgi:DNA-directed RNA polymerase specialized sigma24 family protein